MELVFFWLILASWWISFKMARFIIIIIIISNFWIFFPPWKIHRFLYWVLACRPKNVKDAFILSYAVYRQTWWLNCLNDDHYFTYSSVGQVSKWYSGITWVSIDVSNIEHFQVLDLLISWSVIISYVCVYNWSWDSKPSHTFKYVDTQDEVGWKSGCTQGYVRFSSFCLRDVCS